MRIDGGRGAIAESAALLYSPSFSSTACSAGGTRYAGVAAPFGVGLAVYGSLLCLEQKSFLWLGVALVGAVLTIENTRETIPNRR